MMSYLVHFLEIEEEYQDWDDHGAQLHVFVKKHFIKKWCTFFDIINKTNMFSS